MQPVIFRIPLHLLNESWPDIPLFGYGMMLFAAFIGCVWLSRRLCKGEAIDPDLIPDLAIWLFVAGIAGGRIVYVIQYRHTFVDWWQVVKLWDGGLVLYGALFGGAAGYFGCYWFTLRKHGITHWKMFDVMAPSIALGVALGRIGCLCTGCCYGNVACGSQPEIHFPMPSAGWAKMTERGYQTPFGFLLKGRTLIVDAVEPGSQAQEAGLQVDDEITRVNDKVAIRQDDLIRPREPNEPLELTVDRNGVATTLPAFTPTSIGLHPTQIYETISMSLLLFFLLSYHPYRRHDGELLVLLMLCYGVHRFLNEMLRTDTDPVAFGLTLSQNISIVILIMGAILGVVVWRRPARGEATNTEAAGQTSTSCEIEAS